MTSAETAGLRPPGPPRLLWGRRAIAQYLGQTDAWLRRQLSRAKAPPPTFTIGSARVADANELDQWINSRRSRRDY